MAIVNVDFINTKYKEDIENFNCSDELQVELFLKEEAQQLHDSKTAITRLYFDENQNIIGYFTLYNDIVQVGKQKRLKHWSVFLPTSNLVYFPAIRLHYLGVDKKYRDMGYGKQLMLDSLYICREISNSSGCNFITVEALNKSVSFYRDRFGFIRIDRNRSYEIMILKLDEIF